MTICKREADAIVAMIKLDSGADATPVRRRQKVTSRRRVSWCKPAGKIQKVTSRHRGVSWCKHSRKWKVQFQSDGNRRHIGMYEDEVEAAVAYAAVCRWLGRDPAPKKSSQYHGVCWNKAPGKWQAQIQIDRRVLFLGNFTDETAAARAYDKAVRTVGRDEKNCNFPPLPRREPCVHT